MAFTLWNLLKAALLVVNALAILHPERLLSQYGLARPDGGLGFKSQVAGLLSGARLLRVVLIAINSFVVLVELIF